MAKRYWEEESWRSLVVSKIADRLLIQNNCEFVRVPKLNEAVAQTHKILPYHKRVDRRLSDIQKFGNFSSFANCKWEFKMPERIWVLTACSENVSWFDYFLPKLRTYLRNKIKAFKGGFVSSKIHKWENITSDKEIRKTVEGLTLDFEQECDVRNQ